MRRGAFAAIPVLLLLGAACFPGAHRSEVPADGFGTIEGAAASQEEFQKEAPRAGASRGKNRLRGVPAKSEHIGIKYGVQAEEEARRKRMVIYTAHLQMVVSSVPEKIREATRVAESMGGFMSRRDDVQVTVRVPSERLSEYLAGIRALGTVVSESMSGQDVTEEYLDLEIRLRNGEKTLERLRELLKKANDVKDILTIEREIQRVTGEVERIKGRMKYLSQMAALATVTIRFNAPRQKPAVPRPTTPFHWVGRLGIEKVFQ